eukprot:jgi/Bigna1/84665/fgenesh1_pg.199_\
MCMSSEASRCHDARECGSSAVSWLPQLASLRGGHTSQDWRVEPQPVDDIDFWLSSYQIPSAQALALEALIDFCCWTLPLVRTRYASIKKTETPQHADDISVSGGPKIELPPKGAFVPPQGRRVNDRDVLRLAEMLEKSAGSTVVLTGAGVSTESGIPDYRSPEGSYSKGHKPMTHQDFVKRTHNRKRYWARSLIGWRYFDSVDPCSSHFALESLERHGYISGIITQNVDRLHKRVGTQNLIELHGHNDENNHATAPDINPLYLQLPLCRVFKVSCLSCGYTMPRRDYQISLEETNSEWAMKNLYHHGRKSADIRADGDAHLENDDFDDFEVPGCKKCGGLMMPRVVFFGGSIPKETKETAMSMILEASSVIVLGIYVDNDRVFVAPEHHTARGVLAKWRLYIVYAPSDIVLVNIGPTRIDPLISLKIEAQCGQVLKSLCSHLGVPVGDNNAAIIEK